MQMTIYNWLYALSNDCKIDYIQSQMTIKLTIYMVKWLYNWLFTLSNDYTIDYAHSQWLYNWLCTG